MHRRLIRAIPALAIFIALAVPLQGHEIIVKGTVVAIERARIQIKTGQEKPKDAPAWYPLDRETRIRRGDKVVAFDDAHIRVDERVVAIIDHPDKGPVKTKELRLAPQ